MRRICCSPGQFGALAIAETLFGRNNPGGKLPYTYYKASYVDAIGMNEFACAKGVGRGYRYLPLGSPYVLLPAFHGLSYTSFSIAASDAPRTLALPPPSSPLPTRSPGGLMQFAVAVTNTGKVLGTETVFAFFRPEKATSPAPSSLLPLQRRLCGLTKVAVAPGAKVTATVNVTVYDLGLVDATGTLTANPGTYTVILSTGAKGAREIEVPLTVTGHMQVLGTLPAGI